uniref:Uncharacterized protein n=1 Tax=Palpitomonas bilix TaxID=652834 RepID=A0A7S3D9P2_9EUKA|mmetsp:Transcript_28156/g.71775  ORF Transcript_28156/g.71775 Transcript_28156/m.71775 type:complete len:156 (+) Transcript_28156:453-920(+)
MTLLLSFTFHGCPPFSPSSLLPVIVGKAFACVREMGGGGRGEGGDQKKSTTIWRECEVKRRKRMMMRSRGCVVYKNRRENKGEKETCLADLPWSLTDERIVELRREDVSGSSKQLPLHAPPLHARCEEHHVDHCHPTERMSGKEGGGKKDVACAL